ncbi:LuxR C-terminal-related transcriptional regulator [Leeuwenhoekiella sp. A16]|uniref:LuxR C-terminal-related transcriptional regulator n=1 Tax=Leeuwenhoekiella sp. A16 TaxID=3141462 RepID=UPI003A80A471
MAKTPPIKHLSWTGYMNSVSGQGYDKNNLKIDGIDEFLCINQHFLNIFHHGIPMNYIVDYTSGKYLIMSKSISMILGYKPEDLIMNGVEFILDKYHKDDLRLFEEQIFPERLSILKTIPSEEHDNYIFTYNYRLKDKQGEYVNLMQRNCFIKSDSNCNPLLSLGMVININHYKHENSAIHTVDSLKDIDGLAKTIYKKKFFIFEEDKLLTNREREILLWISEGLTNRQIAYKLNISENTVINHSRNMQFKTGSSNVTALVSFAIRKGII